MTADDLQDFAGLARVQELADVFDFFGVKKVCCGMLMGGWLEFSSFNNTQHAARNCCNTLGG